MKEKHVFFIALVFLVYLVGQTIWGSWVPFSLWIDELFSVTLSSKGWPALMNGVLVDVHPPLYQTVLKAWILLFGNGEVATRLLSMIFALASLVVLLTYQRRSTQRSNTLILAAALFFASSWLFAFYAQTARSYALLLLLSTLSIVLTLRRSEKADGVSESIWLLVLLALSLTHYFGLLLAMVILFLDLLRDHKSKRKVLFRLAFGATLAAWPIFHFLAGNIAATTGGNFWIDSSGPASTLRAVMEGVLAPMVIVLKHFGLPGHDYSIYFLASILVIAVLGALRLTGGRSSKAREDAVFLSHLIFLYVAAVVLIDLHTPISTARNYIVLLPAASLLFGYLVAMSWQRFSLTWQRAALAIGVTAYLAISGAHAFTKMRILQYPQENWKALAAVAEESGLCEPFCLFLANRLDPAVYEYYFDRSMGASPPQSMRSLDELLRLPETSRKPIIGYMMQPQLDALRLHYPGWQCLQPPQYYPNIVALLAPPHTSSLGLASCY